MRYEITNKTAIGIIILIGVCLILVSIFLSMSSVGLAWDQSSEPMNAFNSGMFRLALGIVVGVVGVILSVSGGLLAFRNNDD